MILWCRYFVVDQLFDVGVDEADFGEDLAGGGCPGERFASVPRVDVGADLGDQDVEGGERATRGSTVTFPVATLSAANRLFVPCRT